MKNIANIFRDKLRRLRYLNRNLVLLVDTLMSVVCAYCSYLIVCTSPKLLYSHSSALIVVITAFIIAGLSIYVASVHNTVIRLATFKMTGRILVISLLMQPLFFFVLHWFGVFSWKQAWYFCVFDCLITFFVLCGIRACLIFTYEMICGCEFKKCIFLFSTSRRSVLLADQINRDIHSPYRVVGFLTMDKSRAHLNLSGLRPTLLTNNWQSLLTLFRKKRISGILFSSRKDMDRAKTGLLDFCVEHDIQVLINEDIKDINDFSLTMTSIKPVDIEDLLDREVIQIEIDKIRDQLCDQCILITGAAGSIGSEIVRQLAELNIRKLILLDNAETPLHNLQLEIQESYPSLDLVIQLGDVCSLPRLNSIFERYQPHVVFHAAAYKHVPMVENNPCEGILVNIMGTCNAANCSINHHVKRFVMVSTDKAVNPTNVMGATKRAAELCVQALNTVDNTQFIITRFGNVLGSNGSVIPFFKKQIASGGPVTVTHPDIIRYFMTIPEACRLVLQAASMGQGGEIFVFDMGEQVKIDDLARKMIKLSGFIPDQDIPIIYTGLRPGEKLYEELLTNEENTQETRHQKIRKSRCAQPDATQVLFMVEQLINTARDFDSYEAVRTLKQLVPEFKSQNSPIFEQLDK